MAVLGGRSPTWSANMNSNSRHVKLPFLTTRCQYWGVHLPVDLPIWTLNSRNVKLPVDVPIWTLTVDRCLICQYELYNSRNVKLPFFTTRCQYQGSRSATWSANMSINNRNVSPYLHKKYKSQLNECPECLFPSLFINCSKYSPYLLKESKFSSRMNLSNQKWLSNTSHNSINYVNEFPCCHSVDLPIWTLTVIASHWQI